MTAPDDGDDRVGPAPMLASQSTVDSCEDQTRSPTLVAEAKAKNSPRKSYVFDPQVPLPTARALLASQFNHQEMVTIRHYGSQFFAWDGTRYCQTEDGTIAIVLGQVLEHRGLPSNKSVFNRHVVIDSEEDIGTTAKLYLPKWALA